MLHPVFVIIFVQKELYQDAPEFEITNNLHSSREKTEINSSLRRLTQQEKDHATETTTINGTFEFPLSQDFPC